MVKFTSRSQMPSLRMKKSNMCCLREKNCLRVCHKSSTIAKKSSSHLKISQLEEEASIGCGSCQDAPPRSDLNVHDDRTVEATISEELLGGEDVHLKQLHTSSDDSVVIEGMELQSVSCSANHETIFSPSHAQNDVLDAPDSCVNAGTNIDQDPFHLGTADESDETNIFFDVTERQITLPFLDDSVESSERVQVRPSEEARMDCGNSSFMLAIHQVRPGDQEADLRPYVDSDETQYFDPHSFIRNLPDLSDVVPDGRPTILPKESRERKPITLVLDLDETLVHSTLEHCEDADFTFTVFFNMREHTVYVKERPHLRTFLKKVAEMFEIVVFTASQSIYAEQLLDILDPDGKIISGRAYRESCIFF